jgi:hypothetical protein
VSQHIREGGIEETEVLNEGCSAGGGDADRVNGNIRGGKGGNSIEFAGIEKNVE